MEAEGEGCNPVKLDLAPVIYYWPFQGGTFIVILFVNCYVVFYFQMFTFKQ